MVQLVNVPVGEPERAGETAPRRNAKLKDLTAIKRPAGYKANTVYEFILEAFERGGDRDAMGYRNIKEVHKEKKKVKKMVDGEEQEVDKTWLYYELSDYKYESYRQVNKYIHDYGRGLVQLGLKPSGEHKLHIFASTSHKWMKTFLAAQTQSIPIVTAYDTLGEKGLTHSLVQTESNAIFTDNHLLSALINPLQKAKEIKFIIHSEPIDSNDKRQEGELYQEAKTAVDKILEVRPDIKIVSLDEVHKLGQESQDIQVHPPSPEDLSCIMYTSGSTGDPKGVVLTHENILSGVAGVSFIIDRKLINEKDRIIAFLPLAHIFELAFELIAFYWNGVIGYANVKTLTDVSTRNSDGDIKTFKPTIMVAVAAVWETIKKGITAKIAKQPSFTQKLFWTCYNYKLKNWKVPGSSYLIDNFIFKKVKEATGGQLRYVLNGGSPISKDTQIFISNLLCPMLIGYGLTETVANTTVVDPNSFEYDVQGALSGAITVKLVDVADAGYYAKNDQGEIWIRGYPVLTEYYKNPKETEEAFDSEGWFKTGDIGEWTKTGQLKIIDRKKNLVKTLNGEYIALEKLESVYRSNTYVANICVYADQDHAKPVGIVVPNENAIRSLALELGLIKNENEDIHKALHDSKLTNKVLNALLSTAKSQGLNGIELIQGLVLSDEEWTPQNGFVTSAQKLQRKKILEANKKGVDKAYSK
ncbi:Long chain fatty acyl-CoA synthetase [Wickerhamomyces ciferrii]|uniref:Long chain fatty acyl-CoA synthetase n=1 Tax=Wickerhamomyces ciferrii (strain ATCC 14091 / BCRC 22168 / CBS 111 / JCM 3599 / NBRC 0793 / NRRL Y-1031 F-60-10) TaxID=1206466 RepID=K0KLD4_WICCF|nr:Long chain fatty acyl-CoA synthetase [Wickerhamomyces ciferrii]CCH46070.1 Long chain fatty acyl-CoA synthetase [Wickerhamomyces ciferrii]